MKVGEIMTKDVMSIGADAPISQVAELLFDYNLTGVPVVDEQKHVIGILTEYDLLSRQDHIHIPTYMKLLSQFKIAKSDKAVQQEISNVQSLLASDIMTRPVVTISEDTDVSEAARIFADERINPLPVVDSNGALVGIISRADIVKLFKLIHL